MGRCKRACTSKNTKKTENFPPASIFALGLTSENSLKNLLPEVTNYECNFS
jgi:hypothetical protein